MRPQPLRVSYKVKPGNRRLGIDGRVYTCSIPLAERSPHRFLEALGETAPLDEEAAERRLEELIEAHATTLTDLPDAVVVSRDREESDHECTDLLTFLTVAAKSSSKVFLRGKTPILLNGLQRENVVLLIAKRKETRS